MKRIITFEGGKVAYINGSFASNTSITVLDTNGNELKKSGELNVTDMNNEEFEKLKKLKDKEAVKVIDKIKKKLG